MAPTIATILVQTQPDQRLLELCADGSEIAFETLVKRYRKPIQRYCGRFLSGAAAEDVVQQTFLSTWESIQRGVEIRDLRAWLYRTAHNRALDVMRKAGYNYAELGESLTDSVNPAEQAESRSKVNKAFVTLAGLPETQREALIQTALQGRSQDEVAYPLGVSTGAVRQLVSRARRTVRAAAAALLPFPVIARAAEYRGAGSFADRVRAITSGSSGNGLLPPLLKVGVAALALALVLAGQLDDGRLLPSFRDVAVRERVLPDGTRVSISRKSGRVVVKTTSASGEVKITSNPDVVRSLVGTPASPTSTSRSSSSQRTSPPAKNQTGRSHGTHPSPTKSTSNTPAASSGDTSIPASDTGSSSSSPQSSEPSPSSSGTPASPSSQPSSSTGSDPPMSGTPAMPSNGDSEGSSPPMITHPPSWWTPPSDGSEYIQ